MATKRKYAELLIEEKRLLCEFKKKNKIDEHGLKMAKQTSILNYF